MHFYGWKKGLKTGCYYLRTKAAVTAQKFTVDPRFLSTTTSVQQPEEDHSDEEVEPTIPQAKETRKEKLDRLAREFEESLQDAKAAADSGEGCTMCGS